MDNTIIQFYSSRIKSLNEVGKKLNKKIKSIVFLRFLTFISMPVSYYYLSRIGIGYCVVAAVICLSGFLWFVKKHVVLNKTLRRNAILTALADDEIMALNHKFNRFENGSEFSDTGHNYSYDLDLFGEGSLFQFLNRASTIGGKEMLATWLCEPPVREDAIEARQEAVKELAGKRDWRLSFLATGKMFEETKQQHGETINWSSGDLLFPNFRTAGLLINLMPLLTLSMIVASLWGGSFLPVLMFVFAQWFLLYLYRKQRKVYFRFFDRKLQLIEKYVSLLQEIENGSFSAPMLQNLYKRIKTPDQAVQVIAKLRRHVLEMEYGQNMLVGVFLNSVLMWDIRCIYRLKKWHEKHRGKMAGWLGVIEEFDALISLANFADNHPEFVFPEIQTGSFVFEAKGLGHPLLNPQKRVCSDFAVKGWSKAVIITGANMAGKSTFLRAVGVNMILARSGCPVCAESLLCTPVDLYTNMRTDDSLFNDESYFYSELKRLSQILDWLTRGRELLIIIDEMLKGTNSVDKLHGSKELIRKLLRLRTVALIATHDLKISEMEKEYPDDIFNKRFEINIADDELVFDYKLSDGITQTMNATFLMKKMGII